MISPSPFNNLIRKCCIILLLSGFAFSANAQIKKGEKLMQQGHYTEAIKPLKKDFYGKDKSPEAGLLLAKCYYKLRQYDEARDVMSSIDENSITNSDDRRFYADVFIANNDFSSAYIELIKLLSEDQSDAKTYLWLDKVTDLLAWDTIPNKNSVNTIEGINTIYNEYAPYSTTDGDLIFISDASSVQTIFPGSYNNQNLHLYYKTRPKPNAKNQVERPVMLMKDREYYYHDGPMDNWPNHAKYAFTLRDIDSPVQRIGIYFSTFSGKEADLIPFKYNEKYNTGHPTFCRDGRRLIFASDRPGGYGQMDLWYSDWKDNTWTEPVNMGPIINTPFNEVFPNYYNNRLYFSSDRLDKGYGALDMYYSNDLLGYPKVHNLRAPINSAYDDFAMTFENGIQGYFSSNRLNGTGGDDIYQFSFKPEQKPIPLANLQIVNSEIRAGTPIEVRDEFGDLVLETLTTDSGKIDARELNSNEVYTLRVNAVDLRPTAKLNVLTSTGSLISSFGQSRPREFDFQLLPTEDKSLNKEDNTDYSVLKYSINGQLIAAMGVDLANVNVAVKSPDGSTLATTTTSADGKFVVDGIAAGKAYTIETSGMEEPHQIDVYGKSGAIEQSLTPIGDNRFSYTRAAPPAAWMESAKISVPQVAARLTRGRQPGDEAIKLFDEIDSLIYKPHFSEDNRLMLGSLIAGKAYRLHLPNRTLTAKDRLYIIGNSGDTLQIIRPFDEQNYFFEYMLNSDFGGLESQEAIAEANPETTESIYKMRIADFVLQNGTPLVLRETDKTPIDTLMASDKGIVMLRNIEPGVEYQLQLADTTFAENRPMQIYDRDNSEVCAGESENLNRFTFIIPAEKSLLSMGLSGRFISAQTTSKKLTILDSAKNVLSETYMTPNGNFFIEGLPSRNAYIVQAENPDKKAVLHVSTTLLEDSLFVERDPDSNFYINMTPSAKTITLVDEDKSEVTVNEGIHFNLPDVYYDFNSYYLKAKSRKSLDKLFRFLQDNPDVRVEIQSHTDSRGPAKYNMLLSQKRANAVVEYLTKKGIFKSRLVAVGKGETELTNKCKDGVPCTDAEHAANRRTEFLILKNGPE